MFRVMPRSVIKGSHWSEPEEIFAHLHNIKDFRRRCLITTHIVPGVAEKIAATKEMHILTLAGNTVGIDAAKAIGMLSYLILSYLILSYLISSHLILSHLISSHLILSYLVWSCLILSDLVWSCLILTYLNKFFSYLTLSYLILSFLI